MEELSPEDSLRLNVLLANKPLAIRLNESSLKVHALSPQGEHEINLNATCRHDKYIRKVRELISGHVLGSPGGYPVYLKRWTRMGQMRDESLKQLLLLAEPEAVTAAACAPGLTDELAHRVWWCSEDAENARRMLSNPAIIKGRMGGIMARYLIEHLAFETEPEVMIETVRLVLQEGLIDAEIKADLWKKSARKNAYVVGFLLSVPHAIPLETKPSRLLKDGQQQLQALVEQGNPYVGALLQLLSPPGQAFLEAVERVLKKPATQEVVVRLLDALRGRLGSLRPEGDPDLCLEALEEAASEALSEDRQLSACSALLPWLEPQLKAIHILSGVGYAILRPYLKDSTAIGSLMRRKLTPVTTALSGYITLLR